MFKLKLKFHFLLFAWICLLMPLTVSADTRLEILFPGEQFVAGTGKIGTPDDQIHGIGFNATVITHDENNAYKSSFADAQLSASNAVILNNPHRLDETFGTVLQSGYSGFNLTLSPASNQLVTVTVNNVDATKPGITSGTAQVPIKIMTQVNFALPSIWKAGETKTIIMTTTDGTNIVPYQGQMDIIASGGGINGQDLLVADNVQFVDGQASVPITLQYAGTTIKLTAQQFSPNPWIRCQPPESYRTPPGETDYIFLQEMISDRLPLEKGDKSRIFGRLNYV